MIDFSQQMDLEHVFNFDRFHEVLREKLATAQGGEYLRLKEFIEDNPMLWKVYDVSKSKAIVNILTDEIFKAYGLCVDINDMLHLPKAKKLVVQTDKEPAIRDLIKDFLEGKSEPQCLRDITCYVNDRRMSKTSTRNINASMYQDDEIFVHYENDYWGLSSKAKQYSKTFIRYKSRKKTASTAYRDLYGKEELTSILCEDSAAHGNSDTNLKSQTFELRYSTKREHKPTEFFIKAFSNSYRLDLGLGYFSSACFNVLAPGVAHFVKNGGRMRMYINPQLTEEDYNLLKNGCAKEFEQRLLQSYESLLQVFSRRDKLFFQCLSYLISRKRIEVKMAVLNEGGIAHEKFGIFADTEGNEVVFNGSMNLTVAGLTRNIESIDCTCSWHEGDALKRIVYYHEDFEHIWNEEDPDVTVIPADEFCQRVVKTYPVDTVDELIQFEKEVLKELQDEQASSIDANTPHFPSKYPTGAFPYQVDAYRNWVARGKKGVFAMATGTGKTIASLNCALEEYYLDDYYRLLILVPSLALVEQWVDEAKNFNFRNVICVSSENSCWKSLLVSLANKLRYGRAVNYVIISTYQSFVMQDFQVLLLKLAQGTILIADEAHNIGSESVRVVFRTLPIDRRIALSATPKRIYDEEGTQEIESFFNDIYPYTYNFTMRRAIREERLMPYFYYPRLAYLNEDEMEKYARITRQLVQMYSSEKKIFSNPERAKQLLMTRKNILHKAADKMNVFRSILQEIGEEKLKYCFVYSAAGCRTRSDERNDEQIDEYILKEMQRVLKETYPSVTCNSYTGEDGKEIRKQKLDAFAAGKLDVLFAKNCLDEGVDVPRAEYGIFTSSTGNPRQFIQRRGRLLRRHPDKQFAFIYDIIVAPNFHSPYYDKKFWNIEKNLVEGEMRRVANFASLTTIYYTGAMDALEDLIQFYEIDLNGMVLNEED